MTQTVLARGGFGSVEKVELPDGTVVAKKVFDPLGSVRMKSSDDNLLQRFRQEVNIQRGLPPGIGIPVLDADLSGDQPWFTMPLADYTFGEFLEGKGASRGGGS